MKFSTEEIREVQRRQNGGMTRDEAREAERKASLRLAMQRMVAARNTETEEA